MSRADVLVSSPEHQARLAYLVNHYPAPSQTFIRREIAAHEAAGIPIRRYTVRGYHDELADPADREEHGRTAAILDLGAVGMAVEVLRTAVRRPGRFVRALRQAWKLGTRSSRGHVVGLVYLAEAAVLVHWLRRDRIDHLHVHFGTNATTVAMLARTLGGPPFSFTAHGPEEFDRPEAIKLGEKVAEAEFVAAISEYARSQLFRWAAPEHWSKIHIVHCGLDRAFLDDEPPPVPDVATFVTIGRLSEQKGQLALVAAVNRLLAAGHRVRLEICGEGPMRPAIEAAIANGPDPTAFHLAGLVDNATVRAGIASSRAVLLPSFAEGLPVVIMEALALGRPVVTTFIAGIPELVDEECGWLVPSGDVDALATVIGRVLATSPERLTEMGCVGRERVRERHDVEIEAERLADLLLERVPRVRALG